MADPATRADLRDLADVGRDQADAMVRIAVRVEASEAERGAIRDRLTAIEATIAPVKSYFEAQNAANAAAAAAHIAGEAARETTKAAWLSRMTPATMIAVITAAATLISALGLGTGLAGRAQRVVDALTSSDPVAEITPTPIAPAVESVTAPTHESPDAP